MYNGEKPVSVLEFREGSSRTFYIVTGELLEILKEELRYVKRRRDWLNFNVDYLRRMIKGVSTPVSEEAVGELKQHADLGTAINNCIGCDGWAFYTPGGSL